MNTTLRALVNQAERLVRTEAYQEATALCHAILRRYPRYARCYRILGQAHLGLGDFEEAANLFRRALGVDAEDPLAYAGLGVIYEERGLLDEAIWQMERAFELASGRDELRRELARLYAASGSKAQVQLTRAALARLYARGGLWNKAVAELNDLLAREPYRLDLWVTLARTLWRAGRREEAAVAAQSILDQAPNCLVARLIFGTYCCQEGRESEGRLLLQGAQELDPENVEAIRLLGAESLLPLRAPSLDTGASVPEAAGEEDEGDSILWDGPPPGEALAAPQDDLEGESLLLQFAGQGTPLIEDLAAPPLTEAEALEPDTPAGPDGPQEPAPTPAPEAEAAAPESAPDEEPPEPELAFADEFFAPPAPQEDPPALEPAPAPAAPPLILEPVDVLQRRFEENPDDGENRLALARALVQEGRLTEALPHYDALATPESGLLEATLADLEAAARQDASSRPLREVLGDAYARAGRFLDAMEVYRWLLAHPEEPAD